MIRVCSRVLLFKKGYFSGTLLESIMCPKFSQLFLAFSTLLFFVSFEYFLFTIVTISPGLIGKSFVPTQCKGKISLFRFFSIGWGVVALYYSTSVTNNDGVEY